MIAGSVDAGAGEVFGVARFLSDGTPDPNFDDDGFATVAFDNDTNTFEVARGVAIEDVGGEIVLAGFIGTPATDLVPATPDFAVARLLPTGDLDTSFSTDGKDTIDFGANDRAHAIVMQGDKVVVGGFSGSNFALARYESRGVLDTGADAFDTDGLLTTDFGSTDVANALATSANKIAAPTSRR